MHFSVRPNAMLTMVVVEPRSLQNRTGSPSTSDHYLSCLHPPLPSTSRQQAKVPGSTRASHYFLVHAIDKVLAQRFGRHSPEHQFAALSLTGRSSYTNLLTPDGLIGFSEPRSKGVNPLERVPPETALFFVNRLSRGDYFSLSFDEAQLDLDEATVLLRDIIAQAIADREAKLEEDHKVAAAYRNDQEVTIRYQASNFSSSPGDILLRLKEPKAQKFTPMVTRVRGDLLVKVSYGSFQVELENARFVREQTSIPVPQPLLWFSQGMSQYLVLRFVPGRCLLDIWSSLAPLEQHSVLSQLSGHLSRLRAIPRPPNAPPGPLGDIHTCRGPFFGFDEVGPFATEDALYDWMNARMPPDRSLPKRPLVFTHQDISPRNLILDHDQRLWIIDWERAGWYPPCLEYGCVDDDIGCPGFVTPPSWKEAFELLFRDMCSDDELQCLHALRGYVTFAHSG